MKKIIALILAVMLSFCLFGCNAEKNEIKTLTKNFESACNELDFNAMLDCIEPSVSDNVKSVTRFIGMFSDKDTDEILDKVAGVIFKGLPENSQEFFTSMKFAIDNIEAEENSASATAKITYEISGEPCEKNAVFEYTLISGKWYIADLNIE